MTDLDLARLRIEQHLNEISELFIPEMKLTFIARCPGDNELDFMLTLDDLGEIQKLIERRSDE